MMSLRHMWDILVLYDPVRYSSVIGPSCLLRRVAKHWQPVVSALITEQYRGTDRVSINKV